MDIEGGDLVSVTAEGDDAEEALRRIEVLFNEDFRHAFDHVYSRTFPKATA